jgi:hypothetical protein
MVPFFGGFLACSCAFFRPWYNLSLEILAPRKRLAVPKQKHRHYPAVILSYVLLPVAR